MAFKLPLVGGRHTLIDDEDKERVAAYRWQLIKSRGLEYVVTKIRSGKTVRSLQLHRLITDAPEGLVVDHQNHDTLDNRKSNLRVCTQAENTRNSRKRSKTTSSIFKGVNWHKATGKWTANIFVEGRKRFLGLYESEEMAAVAYNAAARIVFGEFAVINPVPGTSDACGKRRRRRTKNKGQQGDAVDA